MQTLRLLSIYCALSLLPITTVVAAPTGTELITACKKALANDFQGIEGQMCTWYVTPCDCTYGKNSNMPRVCLPSSASVEELAQTVITGLRGQPTLITKNAGLAAAEILVELYPCKE